MYINQGDKTIYTNIEKAKEPRKILSANIDSLNSIVVRTNKPFDTEDSIKVSKSKIKNILKDHEVLIHQMAGVLLEKEYLSSEEFSEMMKESS